MRTILNNAVIKILNSYILLYKVNFTFINVRI